jgi:hypothetical protein
MINSAIRIIVQAMFGVGVLTALGLLDSADAAQRGPAKAANAGVAQELRRGNDVEAEATVQSQTPRVLNRWDMNRRADAGADATSSLDTGHERSPVTAAIPAKGPVVVTIPTPRQAAVGGSIPAVHAAAMTATLQNDETASNGVVCLAGCR